MIIQDITGEKYRIADERLYRVAVGGEYTTECVLLGDLKRSNRVDAYRRNRDGDLRYWYTRWSVIRRNIPFFPQIRIGCKTFRGRFARAIFIAAKGA